MDIKQEGVVEIKQEEVIIKEEYNISDPDPGVFTFSTTPTEDCVKTKFNEKQSESEDYQSEAKSTVPDKLYACKQCGFSTWYRGTLEKHISKCVMGYQQEYFCSTCPYSTKHKSNLKSHLKKHLTTKPFVCELCDFTTSYKVAMKLHLFVHTGEKPYECNQCNYKSSYKSSLKRHLLVHSGDKPYHCKLCVFKTSERGKLTQHLLTHTGEEPHQCEQCDFKVTNKSHLKQHLLVHTGEKPHECKQCNYKTSYKSSLKRHLLLVHSKQCDYTTPNEVRSGEKVNCVGVRHYVLKEECTTDSSNGDVKYYEKFIWDSEIKEEPNDFAL